MKSLILLVVCTFVCVAYAAPADFQSFDAANLLDKISDHSMADTQEEDSRALIQAMQLAALQSLPEKARIQFWETLIKHGLHLLHNLLGK